MVTAQSANQLTLNLQQTVNNISSKLSELGSITTLYSTLPNSATGSFTLSDSIDNYTYICFLSKPTGDIHSIIPASLLKEYNSQANTLRLTSFANGVAHHCVIYYSDSNTCNIIQNDNTQDYISIYGIK